MSDIQLVTSSLETAARRLRRSHALRGLWVGLLAGAALWLSALGIFKLAPIPALVLTVAGAVGTACPLVGLILGGWRKPSLATTARWVDVQRNLKERMSTALEVANAQADPLWRELVVHDAASHAKEIDPRHLVPFRLSRAAYWAALVLAVAAGLAFVPEHRSKAFLQQQADKEIIKDAGRGMATVTRRELTARPLAEPVRQSLETVSSLGDQLQKAQLTRTDALKDLASVQDKLKDQLRDLAKDPGLRRLDEAQRQSGGPVQAADALQKQIDALQQQLGSAKPDPAAMEKLEQKLGQMQQAAKGLSDKSNPEAAQQLGDAMRALSKQAGELGLSLPNLDKAIEALAASQVDQLTQNLDATFDDLEKLKEAAQALQGLSQQQEKLGKDLAEQLKRGQADAAQGTLAKMIQQLKAGTLKPEQLQKLLQEVAQAKDPAKPYGECAKCLGNAASQMQQGDQGAAAESLAQAAKELEKLAQQLADAQALADAIEALKAASQCVGNGQLWSMCQGMGQGSGQEWKIGHGNLSPTEPGKGIGTQASDDLGDPLDAPPPLSPDLVSTKIKGQFSAGAPMKSITLPGVSIKGASKVQFEEAATAAQSDAQSALSQEKVPRAYQGAVRDYFDDLKK
jgi:hypothetical protein